MTCDIKNKLSDIRKASYVPKSSDKIYEELELAREQSKAGKITEAHAVSSILREKYSL